MTHDQVPQVGDVFAGKYRVERVLGKGAMGVVFAARHIGLNERRAIKFMLPTALGDTDGVERFLREAQACARLKSKHVAAVFDVDKLESGAPYIVMEYLEGTDLKEVLQKERALPVPLAVDYMLQALEAVGEAHLAGIVHRDLKPANMFLAAGVGGTPCIKLLDFGIAKVGPSGDGPAQHEMTTTEMIMGSPLYMSPEQMRSSRYVDARCDLWSLGVILYRMVTGTLPFQAATAPELFAMVLKEEPAPPSRLNPQLPPGFEAILMRCLEKDPGRRWSSAAAFAEALKPYGPGGALLETDGATQVWKPPQYSMPDGWYAGGSSPGSDSASARRRRAEGPSSANGSVQAQTSMQVADGATVPISSRGFEGPSSNAAPQSGNSPPISVPLPIPYPPAIRQNAVINSGQGGSPQAPPGYDSGPTGQTSDSWSHTGRGMQPAGGNSRAVAIGVAVGGAFFFAAIALLLLLRGKDTVDPAQPLTQPAAAHATPPDRPSPQVEPQGPAEPMPTETAKAPTSSPPAAPITLATTQKTSQQKAPSPPTPTTKAPSPAGGASLFGDERK